MLDHERLDAYQVALEFCQLALKIARKLPRGFAPLADQLRRAAASVPLNIAEGVGKTTPAERIHVHRIARGEALECAAALDVVRLLAVVDPTEIDRAKESITRVVSMLTRMTR